MFSMPLPEAVQRNLHVQNISLLMYYENLFDMLYRVGRPRVPKVL